LRWFINFKAASVAVTFAIVSILEEERRKMEDGRWKMEARHLRESASIPCHLRPEKLSFFYRR
jgi:hypothetical protein